MKVTITTRPNGSGAYVARGKSIKTDQPCIASSTASADAAARRCAAKCFGLDSSNARTERDLVCLSVAGNRAMSLHEFELPPLWETATHIATAEKEPVIIVEPRQTLAGMVLVQAQDGREWFAHVEPIQHSPQDLILKKPVCSVENCSQNAGCELAINGEWFPVCDAHALNRLLPRRSLSIPV